METENQSSETDKPRPLMGLLKFFGWGVLLLAILAVVVLVWHRARMTSKLQETLAELDRSEPGWRLEDIEVSREQVPEEENSASEVGSAVKRLPQIWPSKDFPSEHFQTLPPNEMLRAADFVLLSRELASVRPAVDAALKLAEMPCGRYMIHYERNPIAILLPHLQECRRIVTLLAYESMRRIQKGESKDALTACRAALNVARSIDDEPFYVSQLVRNACVVHICPSIERTLGQGEPSPEDMIAIQKMLESEDAFPGLLVAARGERAMFHQAFEAVERGELSVEELTDKSSDWLERTVLLLTRMDTRQDHALFLSLINRRIKEAQLPLHEQIDREKRLEQDVRDLPSQALLTRTLLPSLTKMGEAFRRKHATLRCTIAALAVERYRHEHKTWPESMAKLCPQFLASVPLDPFDGKPLRYRRVNDGIIIYSIGQDQIDNGGNLDRERPALSGVDLGVRLWDVEKRRQPPLAKAVEPKAR